MGNMHGVMAVGATMAIASLTGTTIPTWVLILVFVAARFLPGLLGFGGSAAKGKPAAPLDDSVEMLQGTRPTPGTVGKVVVVERWATWCPPCVASVPHLNGIYAKHGSRDDFEIVAVTNETGDPAKIRAFMHQHAVAYPIGVDTQGVVGRGYPSSGIPNATIVGKNGLVYWTGHPMSMDKPLEEALAGAVAEPPGSAAATTNRETKRAE